MKVVLDTNILVSGTFWKGDSDKIIEIIDKGEVELILCKELIDEYFDVINRDEIIDKIKNKNLVLNKSIHNIINNSNLVVPLEKFDIIKEDSDDNVVLECAVEGKVDYIVTQDNHILKLGEFQGIKIITPEEFLKLGFN